MISLLGRQYSANDQKVQKLVLPSLQQTTTKHTTHNCGMPTHYLRSGDFCAPHLHDNSNTDKIEDGKLICCTDKSFRIIF